MNGICKLCQKSGELRKSHIIPEFLFKNVYDGIHRATTVTSDISEPIKYTQQGLREFLLCQECEVKLSQYEGYGKRVLEKIPSARSTSNGFYYIIPDVDYREFKLFMISILWRAGVSSDKFFSQVSLTEKHEARMRHMLLNNDPGETYDYGCILAESKEPIYIDKIIWSPVQGKYKGYRFYTFLIAGIFWCFIVSNHSKLFPEKDRFLSKVGEQKIFLSSSEPEKVLISKIRERTKIK